MSPLPQRKKSPEEITRLRETFGIPGSGHQKDELIRTAEPPVDTIVPSNHAATVVHEDSAAELPKPVRQQIHSFKRSERVPVEESFPAAATPSARKPKPVRSLRKSEWAPVEPQSEAPPDSPLPHQRHSDQEIAEIRRREILALMNAHPNAKLFPAHPGIIIPGYITALSAAVGFHFYQFSLAVTLPLVFFSLAVAAFIGFRKPVSRHHAAFISVISLFVLIFGALHYFPYLRHAT